MNAFIFWSVHRFFAVRLRTARQRSWLPGSGGLRHPGNCGKLLVIEVAQHPPLPGSGVGLPPQREFEGSALNGTLPNFCFSISNFDQDIVSIIGRSFIHKKPKKGHHTPRFAELTDAPICCRRIRGSHPYYYQN